MLCAIPSRAKLSGSQQDSQSTFVLCSNEFGLARNKNGCTAFRKFSILPNSAETTAMADFSLNSIPTIHFGAGRVRSIADDIAALRLSGKNAVLVIDGPLHQMGLSQGLESAISDAGISLGVFSDIMGEPHQSDVEAATDFILSRNADVVICMGGGSAMDIGKSAATIAPTGKGAADFAMVADSLPGPGIPKICIPTTAGTGSELSSTNIFHGENGKKHWIWSTQTKPSIVILDPELTVSLPPHLTAWTGLDAFVHALESCTNKWRTDGNDVYAHHALSLISGALETAVNQPENLEARGKMLLGSAYAGVSIDNCNVAMAHNISHALAGLAPIHHGFATAIGQEVIFPWQMETDTGHFAAAAKACGVSGTDQGFDDWFSGLMTRCGVERRLPEPFKAFSVSDLESEMLTEETAFSRDSTVRPVSDSDISRFAAAIMAMA